MVYGIEYEEFPARIAEVAMWLIDHQMNMQISVEFGQYFARLPLRKSANITVGDALQLDWESIVPKEELTFILGNPPFVGAKFQNDSQRKDLRPIISKVDNGGLLDYVAGWFIKAANYIQNTQIKVGFVSTNSICQGEQVAPLWNYLFSKGVKIHFAYSTFPWESEARGKAAVHVVIVGFADFDISEKRLFIRESKNDFQEIKVKNISPYLVEGSDFTVGNRSKPICNVPEIATGNKPIDGGHYIFSDDEKNEFLVKEPNASKYILPFLGADEFINKKRRWILYLKDISPNELKLMPEVLKLVNLVKEFRLRSASKPTIKLASTPTRYHTENMPTSKFLVIPQVSSERRQYIPIGFMQPGIVCSDKLRILPNATLSHFGILTSKMHMNWMRLTTGRLKSDYQYSALTVYNNFPWPENPGEKQIKAVEAAAQKVLDARAAFPASSLADLYDPLTMPPILVKAHQQLDKAVDLCYRPQAFISEAKRMEFLFELYEKCTAGLFVKEKKGRKKV